MLAVRLSWQHEYIFITEIDDTTIFFLFQFRIDGISRRFWTVFIIYISCSILYFFILFVF